MKQTLKYTVVFLAGALFATVGSAYGAETIKTINAKLRPDIKVSVNGKQLDAAAISYNNTTYLPLRKAAEAINGKIELNGTHINIITKDNITDIKNDVESENYIGKSYINNHELSWAITSKEQKSFTILSKNGKLFANFGEAEYELKEYDMFYDVNSNKTYYSKQFLSQFLTNDYFIDLPLYTVDFTNQSVSKE